MPNNIGRAVFSLVVFVLSFRLLGSIIDDAFPIIKECADGWHSHSIGRRGACSHHGGVVTVVPPANIILKLVSFASSSFAGLFTYFGFSLFGANEGKVRGWVSNLMLAVAVMIGVTPTIIVFVLSEGNPGGTIVAASFSSIYLFVLYGTRVGWIMDYRSVNWRNYPKSKRRVVLFICNHLTLAATAEKRTAFDSMRFSEFLFEECVERGRRTLLEGDILFELNNLALFSLVILVSGIRGFPPDGVRYKLSVRAVNTILEHIRLDIYTTRQEKDLAQKIASCIPPNKVPDNP